MEDREKIMQQWDMYRKMIADGNTSSLPRDWFESIIDRIFEPEDNWQPIETARENEEVLNGTEILLYCLDVKSGQRVMQVGWYDADDLEDDDWLTGYQNYMGTLNDPTHWQPLPSPPEDVMENETRPAGIKLKTTISIGDIVKDCTFHNDLDHANKDVLWPDREEEIFRKGTYVRSDGAVYSESLGEWVKLGKWYKAEGET